jgi:hypothetical protein
MNYVSYDSLLLTNRAIKRRGRWLRFHTAGDFPETYWLEFADRKTAQKAGKSVLLWVLEKRHIGKCNTDVQYNALLFEWFNQLTSGGYILNLNEPDREKQVDDHE